MNHCGSHKYRSYCHRITIIKVLYNILNHNHVKDADIVTENLIRHIKLTLLNVGWILVNYEYLIVLENIL